MVSHALFIKIPEDGTHAKTTKGYRLPKPCSIPPSVTSVAKILFRLKQEATEHTENREMG